MWLLLSLYWETCPLYRLQLFWIQAVQNNEKGNCNINCILHFFVEKKKNVYTFSYFSIYNNAVFALTASSSSSELKILSRSL